MSRYIDADKLTVYFEALAKQAEMEGLYNMAHIHNRCLQIIEEAPTADVVEVVRCKDCAYYREETSYCLNPHCSSSFYGHRVKGEHYCSYGEREEK